MVHVLYPLDNLNEQIRSSFPVLGFIITLPPSSGADPGFQVRGADLKKSRRTEGGANIFGVFRVKKSPPTLDPPLIFVSNGTLYYLHRFVNFASTHSITTACLCFDITYNIHVGLFVN